MNTKFVEATQNRETGFNWGKFMIGAFSAEEWARYSEMPACSMTRLVQSQGWGENHFLVLDLATGEGALFSVPGSAHADLDKHKIWVCPMFEPFLAFMYDWVRAGKKVFDLPRVIELPDAPASMQGYRRQGE